MCSEEYLTKTTNLNVSFSTHILSTPCTPLSCVFHCCHYLPLRHHMVSTFVTRIKQPRSRSGIFCLRQNNPISAIATSYSAQNSTHFGKRRIYPRANRWVSLQEPLSISSLSSTVQLHVPTRLGSNFVNKTILTIG